MIGAYAIERDYSHYIAQASRTVLAVVGTATKGPIGVPTAVTSSQDLVNKFGPLKPDCFGLYAGQYFLSQSSKMYFVRAASDSAAPATVTITGIDSAEGAIDSALVFEFLEKGTFSNGYKLTVSPSETVSGDVVYEIVLKNSTGTTLESIKDVTLDTLVVGYTTKYLKVESNNTETNTLNNDTFTFSGGNDGISDIDPGDYINALNTLTAEVIDINLLAIPGVSDANVITAGLSIAENRGDTLYIVDTPQGLTRDGVIEWSNGGGSYDHSMFNSSYGAAYYDWVNIYDSVNKQQVQVPPSVAVCATYAYSDRNSEVWYAPAGLSRGLLRGVVSPATTLTRNDVELLYDANINSIYEDPQVGLVLWGQKTLYREDTALNRVNVRKLMNYVKKVVTTACNYLVFEPNDRVTWNSFEMKVSPTLESIKNRRGVYEYRIVRGESIVTENDIDNYRMPCMIMLRPTKAAEEIPVYFVITSTGADFNEVLEYNGVVE